MAGWVYILSNPTMPEILKVGYTEKDPYSRAKELSDHTGVPKPYEVEYHIYTTHPYQLEQTAHKYLDKFRTNPQREFFECSYEDAVEAIRKAANYCNYNEPDFSISEEVSRKIAKEQLERKLLEKQKAREEYERNRRNLERKRIEEEQICKQKELENKRIEDRTRLVTEFENRKKKEIFLNKLNELAQYLSKREKYVYSRSFPLDDIELKNWVLDLTIDDLVIDKYLEIHYKEALKGTGSYFTEAFLVPTADDERKLLELEEVVKIKLEKKQIEKQKKEAERLEREALEKEKLRLEKENLEKVKIEIERKNSINHAEAQEKLDLLHKNKISDLAKNVEKDKFDIKNSISIIKYTGASGKLGVFVIFLFAISIIGGIIQLFDWRSIFFLSLGLLIFIMDFRHNKKVSIELVGREYEKQKELVEREYQKQKELIERRYQK